MTMYVYSSIDSYLTHARVDVSKTIEDGVKAARARQTSHLDVGTLEAIFIQDNLDRWSRLSIRDLRELAEELRPAHYWAAEICDDLAGLMA